MAVFAAQCLAPAGGGPGLALEQTERGRLEVNEVDLVAFQIPLLPTQDGLADCQRRACTYDMGE